MPLKLMYITNRPEIAKIADRNGVDRIFIDLETIGKAERQGGMDTVQSRHTLNDIKIVKDVLASSELLVRINPIHENSENEINTAISNGADILMLPFFKTVQEVEQFLRFTDKRVKTMLLVETVEAAENIDEILELDGIDYIHIGLNDLHLGYKLNFMFELVANGTVETLCNKIRKKNIPYGFGGIARLGYGTVPAEEVITEHYHFNSSAAILSRSFCNSDKESIKTVEEVFDVELKKIREFEKEASAYSKDTFLQKHNDFCEKIKSIVLDMKEN